MGMFRSSENEFLLCYDGKRVLSHFYHLPTDGFSQSSDCT